jgi:hypothetical protein
MFFALLLFRLAELWQEQSIEKSAILTVVLSRLFRFMYRRTIARAISFADTNCSFLAYRTHHRGNARKIIRRPTTTFFFHRMFFRVDATCGGNSAPPSLSYSSSSDDESWIVRLAIRLVLTKSRASSSSSFAAARSPRPSGSSSPGEEG